MKKIIALAVAVAFAGPAFAEDAKKPANPAAGNTPAVTTPAAKPGDVTKPQPAATTHKQGEVKKDEAKKDDVKKTDAKKDEKKADVKPSTPAAGAPATNAQKTADKPVETKKN